MGTDLEYCANNCMCEDDDEDCENAMDCEDECDEECGVCTMMMMVDMVCGDVCCMCEDDDEECGCDEDECEGCLNMMMEEMEDDDDKKVRKTFVKHVDTKKLLIKKEGPGPKVREECVEACEETDVKWCMGECG